MAAPTNSVEDAADPVRTMEADWAFVADVLDREGKLSDGTVYRVGFPRRDLRVESEGVTIAPGLALGSYAAFSRYAGGTTMVMGDLVVTEEELPKVTDALQRAGIAQTAVHKHLLQQTPAIWWTHFHGESEEAAALATGVRDALDQTGTPPAQPPSPSAELDLDTAAIDDGLGAEGRYEGGIYKFSFARTAPVAMDGRVRRFPMRPRTAVGLIAFVLLLVAAFPCAAFVTDVDVLERGLEPVADALDDVVFILITAAGLFWIARPLGPGPHEGRG